MDELIWSALVMVIICSVLYFVIKAAVKQAFRELEEEKRSLEKPPKPEESGGEKE